MLDYYFSVLLDAFLVRNVAGVVAVSFSRFPMSVKPPVVCGLQRCVNFALERLDECRLDSDLGSLGIVGLARWVWGLFLLCYSIVNRSCLHRWGSSGIAIVSCVPFLFPFCGMYDFLLRLRLSFESS